MFCNNCGKKIENNEQFCKYCGAKVGVVDAYQQPVMSDDEQLLNAYIGKNAEKIKKNKFNVAAFFFDGLYLLYRKKYLWFFGILFISIISAVLSWTISSYFQIVNLVGSLLVGFLFNNLYVKSSKKKIEKLKNNYKGPIQNLPVYLSRKGGTSPVGIIVYLLISFFIGFITSIILIIFVAISPEFTHTIENLFDIDLSEIIRDTPTKKISDYNWLASDDSLLNINDTSYEWYQDETQKEDNYYKGEITIFNGEDAILEVSTNLSSYGVTEEEQRKLINSYDEYYNDDPINYYYLIELDRKEAMISGEKSTIEAKSYYIGMLSENGKELSLQNIDTATYANFTRIDQVEIAHFVIPEQNNELSYIIPEKYTKITNTENNKTYTYMNTSTMTNCTVSVTVVKTTADKTIDSYISEHEGFDLYENKTINDIDWKVLNSESIGSIYISEKNDKIYTISFVKVNDSTNVCASYEKEIQESLKID